MQPSAQQLENGPSGAPGAPNWRQAAAAAEARLQAFLHEAAADEAVRTLQTAGFAQDAAIDECLRALARRTIPPGIPAESAMAGRWLLARSSLRSLSRMAELRVVDEVKTYICRDYDFYADPARGRDELFRPDARYFGELAKIARLERFVAGQVHWEVSGIPRRYVLEAGLSAAGELFRTVANMRGFSPCFEAHLPNRGGAAFLVETEYKRCYRRIAESMRMQPEIRGIFGISWLHAEETMRITPHLAWMNRLFLDHGGALIHLGPADADSGFLVGSAKRRELYESGEYRPRRAMFVWPRKAILAWADQQPNS